MHFAKMDNLQTRRYYEQINEWGVDVLSEAPDAPILKIAIYRSSSIGDVVLASSCLRLLESLHIDYTCYWLGRQPALGLITSAFPKIIPIEVRRGEALDLSEDLAKQLANVHVVIDLQKTMRSQFTCSQVAKKAKCQVIAWEKDVFRRSSLVLKARLLGRTRSPVGLTTPQVLQYQMMLAALRRGLVTNIPRERLDGIDIDTPPLLPTAHDEVNRPWQKELKFGNWIAVAPGASHPTKRAPTEIFAKILLDLRLRCERKECGFGLLFVGDENDRQIAMDLIDQVNWPLSTMNLAGKLTLWESALALKAVRVLLSNDSGLGHISEAVGTPTAILFGPTVEGFGFAPHLKNSRAFSVALGCRPCSKHGSIPCRYGDIKCFTDLDLRQIASHIEGLTTLVAS